MHWISNLGTCLLVASVSKPDLGRWRQYCSLVVRSTPRVSQFEQAVRAAGADMATLPADIGSVTDRWCLKLHGTCSKPASIVLTRHDYGVYQKEQAASEAVLQALLMTQHVLFVGSAI